MLSTNQDVRAVQSPDHLLAPFTLKPTFPHLPTSSVATFPGCGVRISRSFVRDGTPEL